MMLFYINWCHNQKIWYHFVEQALCYLINVNLFHCALTERKPKAPCATVGWTYVMTGCNC